MSEKVTNEIEYASKQTTLGTDTLTPEDKQEITVLIQDAITQYGSAAALASRCGISSATVSLITQNKYNTQGDDMWCKIAEIVGWRKHGWQIVPTVTNTSIALKVLEDAQRDSLFLALSERAGAGKSTAINLFKDNDKTKNVYHIVCRKWNAKEFLVNLRIVLGLPLLRGTVSINDMIDQIVHHFQKRKGKPILIIDQANSLKPSVLSNLIYIYNELEDRLGCVIAGTDNLEQKIERGVRNRHEGYDELLDRFGHTFVHLFGYLYSDCKKICTANGITDTQTIQLIWKECEPVTKMSDDSKQINVIESGRLLKRKILKYIMLNKLENNSAS